MHALLAIALAQEKYRLTHTSYGALPDIWNGVTVTEDGHYNLAISNVSGSSYTLTATAVGNQTNDTEDGDSCAVMTLVYANNAITKTPNTCWLSD